MEKDIEILKDLLNYWKKLLKEIHVNSAVYQWVEDEKIEQYCNSLENVLNKIETLEEEKLLLQSRFKDKGNHIPRID